MVIRSDGLTQTIPALDQHWAEKKRFLNYQPPNLVDSEGRDIIGAKEQWLEHAGFILDDLSWLLHLPFYKFWSNVIHNSSIMDSITTFLQEAPTFYTLDNFPNDYDVNQCLNKIRQNVLVILARLITNKESPSEYIGSAEHAHLLYNKYIITVPILMDLCQQYGRSNRKIVKKIVDSVFQIQPLYKQDLDKAVTFTVQALKNIERRFEDCPIDQEGNPFLLPERRGSNVNLTLPSLEDMLLYLLDTVSTLSIFMDIYPPSVDNFQVEHFITKIISLYGNTIPEMYKRLADLALDDETVMKHMELRHRLDVARMEILHVYRIITYKDIQEVLETRKSVPPTEMRDIVDNFLKNLEYTLSEKEFVIDYHNQYSITEDFQTLLNLNPDLDTVKCEFIFNSIFTVLDEVDPAAPVSVKKVFDPVPEPINNAFNPIDLEGESSSSATNTKSEVELACLVSEVKDIFDELGEGFIEKCLEHYNYNKESVVNALLEDSLPAQLQSLDRGLPHIPPDPEEASATVDNSLGIQRFVDFCIYFLSSLGSFIFLNNSISSTG